ncbi:MAG: ChbG/HpnK family deacetylase [Acidimicrobiia bacterium]|nr:ChbG/HpnK family deacetylase [Acidimicrobiia bacterium]MYB74863.1 ChbG/HpnK family deacetylase [Acidimicrobiia bacterium]MYH98102.1 ChbG/HpnK family deacetylase [Acidimicrobiia bacterium]
MTRLVIHADDVGMCHGANRAYVELSHFGTITSGSVMVPCPWFSEIAEIAASDDSLDCGIHLTLNAEKKHYRWGPVSSVGSSSGLVDEHGLLWRSVAEVRRNANPNAVEQEWRAQIDRALAAGINVTHLDAHMGSALAPEWCDRYVAVGIDYGVPVLICDSLAAYGPNRHVASSAEAQAADEGIKAAAAQARAAGMPVFDLVLETDFSRPPQEPADYQGMLGNLDDSFIFCAFHPNSPGGAEIEVIEPDTFHVRTDEYELFGTAGWKEWLIGQPYELASMADLA